MTKRNSLTIEEIARRLYKPKWADKKEYLEAVDAAHCLSPIYWKALREHVLKHYGIDITE